MDDDLPPPSLLPLQWAEERSNRRVKAWTSICSVDGMSGKGLSSARAGLALWLDGQKLFLAVIFISIPQHDEEVWRKLMPR
jgi:hypothetical protein